MAVRGWFAPRWKRLRRRTVLIARTRLRRHLPALLLSRLTLVHAPAGFGKTTLLADWQRCLRTRCVRTAWLSLDEDDSEPLQFSLEVLKSAPESAVRGRIVFVNHNMRPTQDGAGYMTFGLIRRLAPELAAAKAAAAVVIRSIGTDYHRNPHTGGSGPAVASLPSAALSLPDADQLARILSRGKPVQMKLVLSSTVTPDRVMSSLKFPAAILTPASSLSAATSTAGIWERAPVWTRSTSRSCASALPRGPRCWRFLPTTRQISGLWLPANTEDRPMKPAACGV